MFTSTNNNKTDAVHTALRKLKMKKPRTYCIFEALKSCVDGKTHITEIG